MVPYALHFGHDLDNGVLEVRSNKDFVRGDQSFCFDFSRLEGRDELIELGRQYSPLGLVAEELFGARDPDVSRLEVERRKLRIHHNGSSRKGGFGLQEGVVRALNKAGGPMFVFSVVTGFKCAADKGIR